MLPYPVASGRINEPPNSRPLPVKVPVNSRVSFLYIPNMKPTSRPPTPMSPAGTSVSGPMWRQSSSMNDCTKRITSPFDLPRGEKSDPPLPPPIGRVVNEFLNVCSKARNFKIDKLTELWKRIPPLYGPIALLCCTR
ncbi:hypothetical protein SDC9_110760 [bioreactor metagenome]|uniref:Uncharacterized protein n=1 Tax=bioreactor metagenome TaxID=1076179 RepID=A0A645BFH2_9ZZZZ